MWNYINSRLKTKSCVEDLKHLDGTMATTNLEKAEQLRMQFDSVFTKENLMGMPTLAELSCVPEVSAARGP